MIEMASTAVERNRNIYDSRGQMLALAFEKEEENPVEKEEEKPFAGLRFEDFGIG